MPADDNKPREADRTDHPAHLNSDVESTYGATPEDKAEWQRKYGKDKDKKKEDR